MKKSELNKLIKEYNNVVEVLVGIAESLETDGDSLTKLSKLTDGWIQSAVDMNPNTPSKVIEKSLRRHCGVGGEDDEARIHIVYNPKLRLQVLKKVAKEDCSEEVREAALTALAIRTSKNSKAKADELLKLYKAVDKSKSVSGGRRQKTAKEALLKHPKFPLDKIKKKRK